MVIRNPRSPRWRSSSGPSGVSRRSSVFQGSTGSVYHTRSGGIVTVTGETCQMSRAYSRMARSELNGPMRATLRIEERVQRSVVAPDGGDLRLRADVAAKVGEHQERVGVHQRPHQRGKQIAVTPGERTAGNQVEHARQLGILGQHGAGRGRGVQPVDRVAEQKEVVGPDRLANVHVGAVKRPDGQRSVHRKFHVACAGRLPSGSGDLLREVSGRIQPLGHLHAEIGHEHHPQQLPGPGIGVDHLGDAVDQPDDELGQPVARCSLAREQEGARHQAVVLAAAAGDATGQ